MFLPVSLTFLIEIKTKAPRNCWLLGKIRQIFCKPGCRYSGEWHDWKFPKNVYSLDLIKGTQQSLALVQAAALFSEVRELLKIGRNGVAIHSCCLLSYPLRVKSSHVLPCHFLFILFSSSSNFWVLRLFKFLDELKVHGQIEAERQHL